MNKVKCRICKKKFATRKELKDHEKMAHNGTYNINRRFDDFFEIPVGYSSTLEIL